MVANDCDISRSYTMSTVLALSLAIVLAYDVYMLVTYRHQITHSRNGGLRFFAFGRLGGSVYLARKAGTPGVRKVGGLHHWRMGRVGGAVYVKAHNAPPSKARIAFALNI